MSKSLNGEHTLSTSGAETDLTATWPSDPRESSPDLNLGRRIGPYRIERMINRGGMGAVYLARREDHFKQRVALKLIHPEIVDAEMLRRFHAERQILANLEHPHIARILDGGATEQLLPFFVMEYVEGKSLNQACAALDLRARLELFRKICAAVHFAHRNLVVHRDLKPSNILVTPEGEPKLLDFGIAKILQEPSDAPREPSGSRPMSLIFASPEQISGEPITTASDVYSLGVLLYRLLSDQHPFNPRGLDRVQIITAVRSLTPPPPSEPAPPKRRGKLIGDLDAIALKALDKDPEQRYGSAAELAEEIRRHFEDLPVIAHRGSWTQRARKIARRHRAALAAALAVLGFTVTVTVLWRHAVEQQITAEHAQAQAERSQLQAERVSDFLTELFELADPNKAGAKPPETLRRLVDEGRAKLTEDLREDPEILADLLGSLGNVYRNLGLLEESLELREEAVRVRRSVSDADEKLAIDLNNLGNTLFNLGRHEDGIRFLQEALAMWQGLEDREHELLTLSNLAAAYSRQGAPDQAMSLYRRALELSRSLDDSIVRGQILYGLGAQYRRSGEADKAEKFLREALEIYSRIRGTDHSETASVQSSLARTLSASGKSEEAKKYFQLALETRRLLFEEDDPLVASSEKNLASTMIDLGDLDAAGELLLKALEKLRRTGPGEIKRITETRELMLRLAELEEADGNAERAADLLSAASPPI